MDNAIKKYEVYLEERKLLVDAEREGARSFDKAILTLAAGALALSITFLEKIVPGGEARLLGSLTGSWVTFGTSIVFTLFSFLASQWACERQRQILDDEWFDRGTRDRPTRNNWTTVTNILNIVSILSFAVGVGLLCYFTFINLPKERAMSKKPNDYGYQPPKAPQKIEKGFTPPRPPSRGPIEEGYAPPSTPAAPPKPTSSPPPEKK